MELCSAGTRQPKLASIDLDISRDYFNAESTLPRRREASAARMLKDPLTPASAVANRDPNHRAKPTPVHSPLSKQTYISLSRHAHSLILNVNTIINQIAQISPKLRPQTPIAQILQMAFKDRVHAQCIRVVRVRRSSGDEDLVLGIGPVETQAGRERNEEVLELDLV